MLACDRTELSIPYLELNPLEKIKRPFPIFILQNYVWGFGVFCGLGLGFVFNEMGKKIRTCSAANFVPDQTGTKQEGSSTKFGFPWDPSVNLWLALPGSVKLHGSIRELNQSM